MEEVKKTGLTFIDTRRLANIAYKDIKNGFVGFGYYLKIIRDEKLWQGQGYDSFNEFLGDEYGKDKSWASRCINLYDKFGIPIEPGELPRLEEQYEVYNVSQLIEMLPMGEELREQVTPDMKIPVIRAMKPKKEKKVATVATPEQEPEPEPPKTEQTQLEKSGKCIHRPEFDCTMEEAQKLIPGTGEDCGCKCCWECVKHGNCEWECNSSERRPAQEPQQPAAKEQQNEEIYCENENQEETAEAENEPSDVDLLRGMLEKEKELLDEMIKVDKVEPLPPKLFREKKILVAALAGMLSDLEEPETEEPKQPALPVMKNNDQRKAWLRDYQSWGLWYTDEHIGARYYKYDFENGVRLIVEEYSNYNEFTGKDYTSSYLHLVGGPEPTKHPMHGYGKWNRHETYDRYPDSETELVEFLKEIQKCSDAGAISTRRLMRNI